MTEAQTTQLCQAMEAIQGHFKKVYQKTTDNAVAMDIEFKFDARGQLVVNQARPWVD
jgi:hypothetical protein